jgi:hypothetical protein
LLLVDFAEAGGFCVDDLVLLKILFSSKISGGIFLA